MRIVYCNPSLHIAGGIERILSVKANYFVQNYGYEVHVIITDGKGKVPFFRLHPSITVHQLDVNYDEWLPFYKRFFVFLRKRYLHVRRLNECLKIIRPDVTVFLVRREIAFINKINHAGIKIAENHIYRTRYLNSLNSTISRYIPSFFIRKWQEQIVSKLKLLDQFVLLTNEDKLLWEELNNVVVIPNPLTFLPDKTSSLSEKKVIAVGRYDRQKGFDLLLSAWERIHLEHPDWDLHIYGDGPLRSALQHQVSASGLSGTCFLDYPVDHIMEKYAESSIFVLSSRFEGFGLVIIEAMSCGLPVVSYDCPCGPKDIITDKEDGFLVPSGSVEALAQNVLYLIENREQRQEMGRQAAINVRRYRIENIALLWKELFESLLQEKKR